jgi:hypothetical protein
VNRYAIPPAICGIYHLLDGDRVLYVGQSTNVLHRVATWVAALAGKVTHYSVFPCAVGDLDDTEREHIQRFDPPMNIAGRTRPYAKARRQLPAPVIRYGSLEAYFDTLPAMVCGGDIRRCGIALNNAQLMAMDGFPRPVMAFERGGHWVCRWRRDDVRQWFAAERSRSAA